jgi:uncharacterized membrane protein YagU involved in acid resistance
MDRIRRRTVEAILWGGLIAGSIDVFAASTIYLVSPLIILKAIASGLLGKPAFSGGLGVEILGLLLQWGMSCIIAAIYMGMVQRLAWARRDWRATGLVAGLIIYLVMTYVVRPLSAAWPPVDHGKPIDWAKAAENLVAMWIFGLIVAWFAVRALRAAVSGDRSLT